MGRPPLPLPRSGQENVKNSRQVVLFWVILSFYKGQKWLKTFTNRSGQARGGVSPPTQAVSLTAFSQFFFNPSLRMIMLNSIIFIRQRRKQFNVKPYISQICPGSAGDYLRVRMNI